jgi:hypothetical protein
LPQLRDAQAERTEPGIKGPVAIAIAVIQPVGAAFVASRADQTLDIGFHQQLQHRLGDRAQEIAVLALLPLQMSRTMDINPKSAFVLLHKLREAMGAEIAASGELSGEVEVDGAFFGARTRRCTSEMLSHVRRAPSIPVSISRIFWSNSATRSWPAS